MLKQERDSMMNTTGLSTKDKEVLESIELIAVNKSEKQRGDDYEFLYWN